MLKINLIFLTAIMSANFSAKANDRISGIENSYTELYSAERRTYDYEPIREEAIANSYEKNIRHHLKSNPIESISKSDLGYLLESAYLTAFYTMKQRYLEDILLVGNELERRKEINDAQKTVIFRTLIGYRKFDAAREYTSKYPDLDVEPVPRVISTAEGTGTLVYRIPPEQQTLVERYVTFDKGTQLVFIVHPLCGPSRQAMQSIESDISITTKINKNPIWLAPASMRLQLPEFEKWNADHPMLEIVTAHSRQDWPQVDRWATPQFYLLKDGSVIDHFSGWPKSGNIERLHQMLQKGEFDTQEDVDQ